MWAALVTAIANGAMVILMAIRHESIYEIFQHALMTAFFALAAIGLLAMARDSEK